MYKCVCEMYNMCIVRVRERQCAGSIMWLEIISLSHLVADEGSTASPRRSRHLSLLELMESPSWDNSAESTAQRLLRHMTGHMTLAGLEKSQIVVQLPTEFLTSLQTDEDLQRSVTTVSRC